MADSVAPANPTTEKTAATEVVGQTKKTPSPGKGKAKAVDTSMEEEDDDEDEEEEEEEEDEDEEMDEGVDPPAILPPGARRSARNVKIDYASEEALKKAGLTKEELEKEDEDEDEFKMKDDADEQ